jgi:hypothetical protein
LCEPAGERHELVAFIDKALCLCIENSARFGQTQRPRTMFEQRQSDNFFYLLYLPAKRRLRHVETTGRARDVHFFGFISSATAMK